jgi:hypothetical protein
MAGLSDGLAVSRVCGRAQGKSPRTVGGGGRSGVCWSSSLSLQRTEQDIHVFLPLPYNLAASNPTAKASFFLFPSALPLLDGTPVLAVQVTTQQPCLEDMHLDQMLLL